MKQKHSKKENSVQQDEILKRIGTKIRNERNRLGLSLEALARKVGISKMTLHRIETGMTSPTVITLTEISFHLKKPIESLIREGDPKVVLLKKGEQDDIMDPESGIRVLAPRGLITNRIALTSAELKKGYAIETHVYHQAILNDRIPLSIGGGIGQSRTLMWILKKAHLGEVSVTVWPRELKEICARKNIHVLE